VLNEDGKRLMLKVNEKATRLYHHAGGVLLPDGNVIATPLIQRVPGEPTGKARPVTPAPREHRRIAEFKR